jgi:hypothetical protein
VALWLLALAHCYQSLLVQRLAFLALGKRAPPLLEEPVALWLLALAHCYQSLLVQRLAMAFLALGKRAAAYQSLERFASN